MECQGMNVITYALALQGEKLQMFPAVELQRSLNYMQVMQNVKVVVDE